MATATPAVSHLPLKIIHDIPHSVEDSPALRRRQITDTLLDLRERGFGGIVTNVSTWHDYLESDSEWALFAYLADECERLGMRLWVYDERGYPSGGAGGLTLRDYPEGEARSVVSVTRLLAPGESGSIDLPRGHESFLTVGLYACDSAGVLVADRAGKYPSLLAEDYRDTTSTVTAQNTTESHALLCGFAVKRLYEGTHCIHNVFEARRYIDVTNPDAVRAFISNTYEKYAAVIPEHMTAGAGDSAPRPGQVEAIFTDEPSFMGCYINEGLFPPTVYDPYDMDIPLLPVLSWGRDVENRFTSRYGYDLRSELISIFCGGSDHAGRVRLDFWRLMSDLYEQSFFAQLSDWCARHKVSFSGHILLEDNIRYHTVFEGNFFHLLRHMHTPGIDMLQSLPPVVRQYAFTPKLVSSIAHAYRRPHVMSEVSAHAQGGKVTYDEMYGSLCAQYALGVDTFTYYYPQDFMDTETYAGYNRALGRIDHLMQGTPAPEVFLYYPIETFQLHHRPSAAQYGSYTKQELAAEAVLGEVLDALLDRQCDPDFIDFDLLATSTVQDGRLITPSGLSAQALILPPMEITENMAALFARLSAEGLRILTVRDRDGLFAPAATAEVCGIESLVDALDAKSLHLHTTVSTPGVLALTRTTAAGKAVMLTNTQEQAATLTLSLSGMTNPCVYDPMTDAELPAAPQEKDGRLELTLTIPAYRALVISEEGR